jgi:hypothetical protein
MSLFKKSPARLRDEAAAAVEASQKHHAGCVDEYNCAVDHLATLKLRRLDERKARIADAVAKRSGAEAMADDDPGLMRSITKATLYKQGLFKAANDARLDVIHKREALAAAEKAAADAAYIDVARGMLQLLGQLVPLNQHLQSMQTGNLPLLSLPEWSEERFQAWQREFYALAEPRHHATKQPDPMRDLREVIFDRDTHGVSGDPLDGRAYGAGEGAGFDPNIAAHLVASGAAHYRTETSAGAAAVERARKRLAEKPTYEGSARENLGWAVSDNEQ